MKTSAIFKIFTTLAAVIQASALFPRLEESTNINLRTQATCGDVTDLAQFAEVYIPSFTAHIYSIYNNNITSFIVGNPGTQYQGVAALIFSIQDTSTTERATALASGYVDYMTPAGYIYPSQICGSVPLYRLHFIAANPDYIYTTSVTERDNAIAMGFAYEGVAGYVYDLLSCGSSS
ncbi:hypothetical protein C8R45DRAFT_946950 [Mycena sanguinolenta]|nr:hypothetical protein C8R45DRAFT_946950 [Mycena sanguinolenta]